MPESHFRPNAGHIVSWVLLAVGCSATTAGGDKSAEADAASSDARIALDDAASAPPRDAAPDRPVPFLDASGGGGVDGAPPDARTDAALADATADATASGECARATDCDDGFFCNGIERCERGACLAAENAPCTDDVECTANLCDEETDECAVQLIDERCAEGQICDPKVGCFLSIGCRNDDECDDGAVCNGVESCREGQCRPGEPLVCDDGQACTVDRCDEARGACRALPDHGLCAPGELCSLQEGCRPRPPCIDDAGCDDGLFCNGRETCDVDTGLCSPGVAPDTDDGVGCTVDACDEDTGEVVHTPRDARCNDGVFCDGVERCRPDTGCVDGPPPVLSDGVRCTTDRCDEALDFVEHLPDDAACDDGLFCNGAEVCDPVADCAPGDPPALSDGIGCTRDTCSEIGRRVLHVPEPGVCDDGLFCNGAEVCDPVAGCAPGLAPDADDGLDCTVDACDEGSARVVHTPLDERCADGLFCNGDESCDPAVGCLPGAPPEIDDGLDCTADACDEAAGGVSHLPVDALCDDGLVCSGAERCDAVRGCLPGDAPGVDDGIDCTLDACDPITGAITHTPDDGACDDGLFCNGAETCDAARGCRSGTEPALDDAVDCTRDTCDEDADVIVHTPVSARCDDSLFCNGAEVCDPVADCLPGMPPALTDDVGCTVDTCDEANDRVIHTPDDSACDDRTFCNGAERCDAARGCLDGPDPALDDDIACTTDTCDEANDRVVHTPNNASCSNGRFCDGAELCDAVRGCLDGPDPALDDNVACTTDACDEANDRVTHTPNNAACTNGQFCDGVETCDAARGCLDGPDPVLTDNIACTTDTCDEANDRVVHTPNNALCANANFCDGVELCDAARGCLDGPDPVLTDNIACTTDTCDEANDRVVHTPNNALCSDGNLCDGAEVCVAATGCREDVAPPAGTVCVAAPRSICLANACSVSRCGDRYVDGVAGETCDDGNLLNGDGCSAACQSEGGFTPDYNGTFGIAPGIAYTCAFLGFPVVTINTNTFVFSVAANVLSVTGIPDCVMRQNPAPGDENFSVTCVLAGGCNETYTLAGSFSDDDHFCGVMTIGFNGAQCGLTDCSDQVINVCGTRQ
jgi:cysteine-rich repeat protein